MNIGIIGTRGIPNQYGGFEQFAENFSIRMAQKGHDITVYASHRHTYGKSEYRNVHIVYCYDPEYLIGTAGQFVYDLNCIHNSRKQNFDVILQLGYTSSTIWSWYYPKSSVLVTNMDGLEWTRTKYNKITQWFLTHAEKWGVRYSDHLIADSIGIQEYLKNKYNVNSVFIPYGAAIYEHSGSDDKVLAEYGVECDQYDLVIARFEPENNIEMILKVYAKEKECKLLLMGNYNNTRFGNRLYQEYGQMTNIIFGGANYNVGVLNVLRYHSRLYLHGHSVGGTNPSLLEAMACSALIAAHDNVFNKSVLKDDAFYFSNCNQLMALIKSQPVKQNNITWLQNNKQKILAQYNWDIITEKIESYFSAWRSIRQ